MTDNISDFNVQVLRAIAALYKAHPALILIDQDVMLVPQPHSSDPDYGPRMMSSNGTVLWLHRNGFVSGHLQISDNYAGIREAQLTSHAFGILSQKEQNANNQTLGQVAVSGASAQPGTREETLASELVARRLLGS